MFDITKESNSQTKATELAATIDNGLTDNTLVDNGTLNALSMQVMAGEDNDAINMAYHGTSNKDARNAIDMTIRSIEESTYMQELVGAENNAPVTLSNAQRNAVAIIQLATSNTDEFQKTLAMSSEIRHGHDSQIINDVAAYAPQATFAKSSEVLAGEAFESVELTGTLGLNAIAATRQAKLSPMAEMFAPTVALPPSKNSVAITVRVPLIEQSGKHALNGVDGLDRKRVSAIEARYDSKILKNDTTKLRAVYRDTGDDDSTVSQLAPADEVAPRTVTHNATECKVSPIRCGMEIDLKGLNSTGGINGKREDDTSMIAGSPRVGGLYVRLEKAGVVENIFIDTRDISAFIFTRAENQSSSKLAMSLSVDTHSLMVADKTPEGNVSYLTAAQTESQILSAWATAGIAVNLRLIASGVINLESGKALVSASLLSVADAITKDGDVLTPKSSEITAVLKDVTMTLAYWEPEMSMTNTNWMREGKLVGYNEYCFPYAIPTLSPFTLKEPTDEKNVAKQVSDLSGIVTQQADNNVALAVQSYSLMVERAAQSHTVFKDEPGTLGAGSVLLRRPYHRRITIDCLKDINTGTSTAKRDDFRAMFLNILRHEVAEADITSGLQGAINSLTGNSGKKVKAHIGCDPILYQHLFESGEPRTLGNYDFQIETCELDEYKGKCYVMLGLAGGTAGENPLATGQRWFTPDILRSATLSGNTTIKHTMIIPHYSIVFNVPVMIECNILNLGELFTKATSTLTEVYTATDKPLEVNAKTTAASAPAEA